MFAPSIPRWLRVNAQRGYAKERRSLVRRHKGRLGKPPRLEKQLCKLRSHFSVEVYDGNFRINTPRMTPASLGYGAAGGSTRMSVCRGSRAGCGPPTSDLRLLTSAQRGRLRGLRPAVASRHAVALRQGWLREGGFTLLELLIVVGIIATLLVLMAPAFTYIKGGTDVTSAAYTIKGVLETARTYAKANNTYTWVGFAGSIGSTVTGSVALVVVASKDGTDLGTSVNQVGTRVDITTGVTSVGKVMRLDNAHIGDTGTPQPSPSPAPEFETRPSVNINYRIGATGTQYNSDYYFIEQGTQFDRWIRFSPRGETVVKGGDTQITQYAEVGLLPTHGTALAAGVNPASGNLVAVQISGFGGNVRIYRR